MNKIEKVVAVVAVVGMGFVVAIGVISAHNGSLPHTDSSEFASSFTIGLNGLTETRCINGMQFVVGQSGSVQQILGPNGGGIPCQ